MSGPENFTLENFGPLKMPLKIYFQFKVTVLVVINVLSVHYLWTWKTMIILSQKFFLKAKSLNLKFISLNAMVHAVS